jgi:hypothetical protein
MSLSPPQSSPQQPLSQLSSAIQESTQMVSQMNLDVTNLETSLNDSLQSILTSFQHESEQRRKLVEAFKNLSELLIQCQKNNTPITPDQLASHQTQITTLTTQQEQQMQQLQSKVQQLEQELAHSKEQITSLQSQVDQATRRRELLAGENNQLFSINQGYKTEIQQQMTLFDRLNQSLVRLKNKISTIWHNNNTQTTQPISLYLPDTLLSEIRNDVIRGDTFAFLDAFTSPSSPLSPTQKTLELVNSKWIEPIGTLQKDLHTIMANLKQVDPTNPSFDTWKDYAAKLEDFQKMWNTKSIELVDAWISTRNKRHSRGSTP